MAEARAIWGKYFESRVVILRCRPEKEEDATGAEAVDFKGKEVFYMPGFDGTGPEGMGHMTGGGRGYCNPSQAGYGPAPAAGPGYLRAGYGRGFGRGFRGGFGPGFGWGRGYGRGFGWRGAYPTIGRYGPTYNAPYGSPYNMNPEDEVNMLKSEADAMKSELDAISKRIQELDRLLQN